MASQHCPIKNGARGNGAKHARYIAGEGAQSKRDDLVYLEDGNLPKWATDAQDFFAAADEHERGDYTRKLKTRDGVAFEKNIKGRAYKELEVAIPREASDPVKWAKDFAKESIGSKHPYRLAIHDKEAKDGGRNVHMHLMFSTRTMDGYDRPKESFFKNAAAPYRHSKTKEMMPLTPERIAKGGAKKSTYWDSQVAVHQHRERFEKHVQRVAPSFKLERSDAPEQKIGPKLEKAGPEYERQRSERSENVAQLRGAKRERRDIDTEIKKEKEIEARLIQAKKAGEAERKQANPSLIDLGTDVQAAKREQSQPKSRTDELFAQLEAKRSDHEGQHKDKENPIADFVQQRQKKNELAPKPADQKEAKTMDDKQPEPAKDQAIEQKPQQAEQQREQASQSKEQEPPRSTDDLFAQLERQQQQKRDERDRDGTPDLER